MTSYKPIGEAITIKLSEDPFTHFCQDFVMQNKLDPRGPPTFEQLTYEWEELDADVRSDYIVKADRWLRIQNGDLPPEPEQGSPENLRQPAKRGEKQVRPMDDDDDKEEREYDEEAVELSDDDAVEENVVDLGDCGAPATQKPRLDG